MKVPFTLASGGIYCAAEFFLITFGNGDAHNNLLSFLCSADKRNSIPICADAERRNGDYYENDFCKQNTE